MALVLSQDTPGLSEAIDLHVKKIRGYTPVESVGLLKDEEFLLKVTNRIVGRNPTPLESEAFRWNQDPNKRAKTVDALLKSREYAEFWARKFEWLFFEDSERIRFRALTGFKKGAEREILRRFTTWLADELHQDRGWDDIVKAILTAKGKSSENPAMGYLLGLYRGPTLESEFARRVPSHFLGIRMWCAGCHDHAFDQWRQEQFWSFGAFARDVNGTVLGNEKSEVLLKWAERRATVYGFGWGQERRVWTRGTRLVNGTPLYLFGGMPKEGEPFLESLVSLMTESESRQFPRATANRIWAWLFGRGMVHPAGDFNMRNRPVSKPLLAAVTKNFADGGYSIKSLIRGIVRSQTYQRRDAGTPFLGFSKFRQARRNTEALRRYEKRKQENPLGIRFERPEEWREGPFAYVTGTRRVRIPYEVIESYSVPDKEGRYPEAELAVGRSTRKQVADFPARGKRHFFKAKLRTVESSVPPVMELTGGFACDSRFDDIRTFRVLWGTVEIGNTLVVFRLGGVTETVDDWRDEFFKLLGSVKRR